MIVKNENQSNYVKINTEKIVLKNDTELDIRNAKKIMILIIFSLIVSIFIPLLGMFLKK